jgi:putative FmdB family regulatory protein
MPIFEYKCKSCGHKMEFLEKSGHKGRHVCRKCQSSDLQKLLSGFAIGQDKTVSSPSQESCPTGTCPLT